MRPLFSKRQPDPEMPDRITGDVSNFMSCLCVLRHIVSCSVQGLWLVGILSTSVCASMGDDAIPAAPRRIWDQVGSLSGTRVTHETVVQDNESVERFRLLNSGSPEEIQIRATTAPSMLHYDYEASLKIHSTVPGIRLGLLIVLPHQPDPRTGKPLETILKGDVLRSSDEWQTLRVSATQKAVEAQLRRIRADLNRPIIRMQEAIIVGLVLAMEATPGEAFFDIGSDQSGPVISPSENLIQLVSSESKEAPSTVRQRNFVPIDVELSGLMLDERPAILRLAPDHGEHVETLRQLGLNAVWVPDYTATARARELYESGLAVLATPPHPEFEPGDFSRLLRALPPLDKQCPNVSAWYQGTRIVPEEQPRLLAVSREVRSADRAFQRLQMADVTGAEGAVAREIDLVGIGRHVVGRDITFGSLRNLLIRRQQNAGQLSVPWTWIQTEPSSTQRAWRQNLGFRTPVVEPEQIQQGVYAALSAGYKGVGFWKTHALRIDNPGDRETIIAIELACMEIELLEPFLARGRMEGHLALQTTQPSGRGGAKDSRSRLNSTLGGRTVGVTVAGADGPATHDAAVISGKGSTLILATAWDDVSQFVPGSMFEQEVNLVVASSETASAWQISTTNVEGLPREVTAGGLSLKIKDFDQSAALIVLSNPASVIPELEQTIYSMAPRAAARLTELASLKYVRVLETIELLREEHSLPPGAEALVSQSKRMLELAEIELNNKDFHVTSLRARAAMRFLRQAQQACWNDAIRNLTSPSASPHTISFSTLPDHWKLMNYLDQEKDRLSDNLLSSGDFENLRSTSQAGWSLSVPPKSPYSATADIIHDPRTGKILRLIAWQSNESSGRTLRDDAMPLLLTSPEIPAAPGDVMIVSGRVRKGRTTSPESKRPLILFDSELGPENSIRTELDSEWTRFEMIRPIGTSTKFSVSLGLTGQANVEEVHVDDLTIRRLPAAKPTGSVRFTGNIKRAPDDQSEIPGDDDFR